MSDPLDDLIAESLALVAKPKAKPRKQKLVKQQTSNVTPFDKYLRKQEALVKTKRNWHPVALCTLIHQAVCKDCGAIHSCPDRFLYILHEGDGDNRHLEVFDPEIHNNQQYLPKIAEYHRYDVLSCDWCTDFSSKTTHPVSVPQLDLFKESL